MKRKLTIRHLVTLTVVLIGCCLAIPGAGEASRPAPLEDDPRLGQKLTLIHPRIYLGELAEKLATETGVSISVSEDRFPMGGIEVCCLVRDQPASLVMRCLAELYSTRGAVWSWRATESGGGRKYRLVALRTPAEAAGERRADIRRQWEADALEQYRVARLPDAERLRAAAQRPDLFGRVTRPGFWTSYLAAGELTEDEYRRALQGERIEVPRSRLSPATRERADAEYRREKRQDPQGHAGPVRTMLERDHGGLAPRLSIDPGSGGYTSVIDSWWEGQWLKGNDPEWRGWLAEESRSAMHRYLELGPKGAGSLGMTQGTREAWLEAVSVADGVSIIADVHTPTGRPGAMTGSFVRGSTPLDTLTYISASLGCYWKRSGDIWLIRRLDRLVDPRQYLVSWQTVRELRRAADRQDGLLDLEEVARVAALEPPQWAALAEEFPDAEPHRLDAWAPLFRLWSRLSPQARKDVLSPKGLRLSDAGISARRALLTAPGDSAWPGKQLAATDPTRCRFRLEPTTASVPTASPNAAGAPTGAPQKLDAVSPAWRWEVKIDDRVAGTTLFVRQKRRPLVTLRQPSATISRPMQ